jgi:3-hydroxy-9,10-secoandrosta-1,3,5(10)-triene-9,17-dione monooxygenase reductase component
LGDTAASKHNTTTDGTTSEARLSASGDGGSVGDDRVDLPIVLIGRQRGHELFVEADTDREAVGCEPGEEAVVVATALAEAVTVDREREPRHDHHVEQRRVEVTGHHPQRVAIDLRHIDTPTPCGSVVLPCGGVGFGGQRIEHHHVQLAGQRTVSEHGEHVVPRRRRSTSPLLGVGGDRPSDRPHVGPQLRLLIAHRSILAAPADLAYHRRSMAVFDSTMFRAVLGHLPTGVTVVTGVGDDNRPLGFTIGSFTSVSLEPPLVGFFAQDDSDTWAAMAAAGKFCVNVLGHHQHELCWKMAKKGTDSARFDGATWTRSPLGLPVLDRVLAWIDCEVDEIHPMGDHIFVLGRVIDLAHAAEGDHIPLVFFRGQLGGFFRPEDDGAELE